MAHRETPGDLFTAADDIAACSNVKDRVGERRFGYYQEAGGDRARAFQGRTVAAEPRAERPRPTPHRYLIHATHDASDRRIFHEVRRLISGRREFHFAEAIFIRRLLNYLRYSAGQHGMWILVGPHDARIQRCDFRLLPNDVVATAWEYGLIPPECINRLWGQVDVMCDLAALKSEPSRLVDKPARVAILPRWAAI